MVRDGRLVSVPDGGRRLNFRGEAGTGSASTSMCWVRVVCNWTSDVWSTRLRPISERPLRLIFRIGLDDSLRVRRPGDLSHFEFPDSGWWIFSVNDDAFSSAKLWDVFGLGSDDRSVFWAVIFGEYSPSIHDFVRSRFEVSFVLGRQ